MNCLLRPLFYLTVLGSLNALAAPLATPKFGFVNFEAAFAQELEAQKYIKELEALEASIAADEQKARVDIEAKMTKFKNSMAKLKEDARMAEENKLSAEIGELQQKFNDRRNKLMADRQQKVAELENKNRLLVESISRKGSYSMVFNAASLVYVSDEIKKNDLTQDLVNQYNKAYPVKAAAPAAPAKAGAPAKAAPVAPGPTIAPAPPPAKAPEAPVVPPKK